MSNKTYDTAQPILVVVRRGRGGRGYTVAPVDNPTDIAACADVNQVGDAVVEMLEDENQPRVDIDALLRASDGDFEDEGEEDQEQGSEEKGGKGDVDATDEGEDDEGDEDGDEEDEEEQPWYRAEDPADALLITGLSKLLAKGRSLSNRPPRRRRRRKGKRT